MDHAQKMYLRVKKNQIQNSVFKKAMTGVGEDDTKQNKIDYLLLAKQVDSLCSQVTEFGISPVDNNVSPTLVADNQ